MAMLVVQAGIVPHQESKFGLGGQVPEGVRGTDAGVRIFRLPGQRVLPHFVLGIPEAALAPKGGGHFLDLTEFHVVEGSETADMLIEELVEISAVFVGQNDDMRQVTMPQGVVADALFAFGSLGATGLGAVGAGSLSTSRGNHSFPFLNAKSRTQVRARWARGLKSGSGSSVACEVA